MSDLLRTVRVQYADGRIETLSQIAGVEFVLEPGFSVTATADEISIVHTHHGVRLPLVPFNTGLAAAIDTLRRAMPDAVIDLVPRLGEDQRER